MRTAAHGSSEMGDFTLTAGVVVGSGLLMLLMFGYWQEEFHDLTTAIGWLRTLV